jgi:hypothetical protein
VTGLLISAVCFGWLIMSVFMARRTYRREYAAHVELQTVMHGNTTPERARKRALDKAYEEVCKWPFTLAFGIFDWLITTEHLIGVPDSKTDPWNAPERDGTDELIEKLDKEINGMRVTHAPRPTEREREAYLALKHGPLNACPCGYRTECPIHCGTGHTTGQCPARGNPEFQ